MSIGASKSFKMALDGLLERLGKRLRAMAIFTPDGINLYSKLPEGIVEEFFLASGSALIQISSTLVDWLDMGELRWILVDGDGGKTMALTKLREDVLLCLVVEDWEGERGKVEEAVENLRQFLRPKKRSKSESKD